MIDDEIEAAEELLNEHNIIEVSLPDLCVRFFFGEFYVCNNYEETPLLEHPLIEFYALAVPLLLREGLEMPCDDMLPLGEAEISRTLAELC